MTMLLKELNDETNLQLMDLFSSLVLDIQTDLYDTITILNDKYKKASTKSEREDISTMAERIILKKSSYLEFIRFQVYIYTTRILYNKQEQLGRRV